MAGVQHLGSREGTGTPKFPTRQLTILALCRICEPIAFMSIFPYIYFMIRDFGLTTSESQIAIYAGMVTSAFAFAEFSSGVPWGRLSDRIGRKPVLLTGLAGTALSMAVFGFAQDLKVALVARALGGLLNGNIGVLQTTVAEMVTVKEHQPRAYTIMPFVWCLGSILGPCLGGALAKPVQNYPNLFPSNSIWDKFPYLLPNLVCTCIVACGVVIGILFLEETHAEKKHRRDIGLEAGQWLIRKFSRCAEAGKGRKGCEKDLEVLGVGEEETMRLLGGDGDEQPPGYRTTEGSPNLPSTPSPEPRETLDLNDSASIIAIRRAKKGKPAVGKAFTKQVVLNIVGYGILAYHTMTFDAMLPTHLSAGPEEHRDQWVLPFKFVSGYAFDTKQIGMILSVQGIYSMIVTVFIFPIVVRRLGALRVFRLISVSYPVLYITTPYLALLPDSLSMVGVYGLVVWKCTFATMAYPSNAILLTNSAPSLLLLGTINGVAASTASLSRTFGPTVSGLLFSAGLRLGYSGLAWWCTALIAVAGAFISFQMSDKGGRMDIDEKNDEDLDLDLEIGFEDHILDHTALDTAISAAEARTNINDDDDEIDNTLK